MLTGATGLSLQTILILVLSRHCLLEQLGILYQPSEDDKSNNPEGFFCLYFFYSVVYAFLGSDNSLSLCSK